MTQTYMTRERYNVIRSYLDTGRVVANTETGAVFFPYSRNSKSARKTDRAGYLITSMEFPDGSFKPVKVHQIIAVAGGLDPVGKTIDHINGNKQDNRLSNLRVLTGSENSLAAWHEQGLSTKENRARNENSGKTKLCNFCVKLIKYSKSHGGKVTEMAKLLGMSHSRISDIVHGKTWKEIGLEELEDTEDSEALENTEPSEALDDPEVKDMLGL